MNAISEIKKTKNIIDKKIDKFDHIADERIPNKDDLMESLGECSVVLDHIEKCLSDKDE